MARKYLYVMRERSRHGKLKFYFRKDKDSPRIRLPDIQSEDFVPAYLKALQTIDAPKKRLVGVGSLEWLIARYRETTAYSALSPATRRQRDNIFKGVIEKSGKEPFKAITRKSMVAARDKRADTPAQARNFLDAMRGLFRWALEAEHVTTDPTAGVSNPKRKKGEGFAAWTDADVAAYDKRWPRGTKERVWKDVLLFTGLRRGDAVIFGKQHVRDSIGTVRTEKTGMEVDIHLDTDLLETLKVGPVGDLIFIVGDNGQPLTKETFGNYFRHACSEAGVSKSAHGLRKLAATKAAEAGCTVAELESRFGWSGGGMASPYTKTANRKRLAASAAEKIKNANSPHPTGEIPAPSLKSTG